MIAAYLQILSCRAPRLTALRCRIRPEARMLVERFPAPPAGAAQLRWCDMVRRRPLLFTRIKPEIDPRLDRGELYEGDRAVSHIWLPPPRF